MRVLNVVLVLVMLLAIMHVRPNLGGRVLINMDKKDELRLQALDKGPVPPSGPSGCSYIPGSGGTHCLVKEMHVASNTNKHHHGGGAATIQH